MVHTKAQDLEAFCATCPAAQEVSGVLQAFGFVLTFHMDLDASPEYEHLPSLPAQFHFRDSYGTEAIFLAGPDVELDGVRLPAHAFRFWMYPDASASAFRRIAHALALRWSFRWQPAMQVRQDEA